MDAPPCGTLSCVDCDLAPNLEADIDLETGDSDPRPSPDIQGRSADFEPFLDIQGQ